MGIDILDVLNHPFRSRSSWMIFPAILDELKNHSSEISISNQWRWPIRLVKRQDFGDGRVDLLRHLLTMETDLTMIFSGPGNPSVLYWFKGISIGNIHG